MGLVFKGLTYVDDDPNNDVLTPSHSVDISLMMFYL